VAFIALYSSLYGSLGRRDVSSALEAELSASNPST
jgi:hypothetical protein